MPTLYMWGLHTGLACLNTWLLARSQNACGMHDDTSNGSKFHVVFLGRKANSILLINIHTDIIYNKPTRCNSGSIVFIKNYKYALHVSDALCVHLQEHYFGHGIVQGSPTWTSNRIYSNPTHDKHQWLLLRFIVLLKMDAKGVRNM